MASLRMHLMGTRGLFLLFAALPACGASGDEAEPAGPDAGLATGGADTGAARDAGAPDAGSTDGGGTGGGGPLTLRWSPSLTFPAAGPMGTPLPNNAMNLTSHRGALYAGFATVREPAGHSDNRSYIYRLDSAGGGWALDATFPPGTGRVDALESIRFETDLRGAPLTTPVDLLVAATNWASRDPYPVRVHVRDDGASRWMETTVGPPIRAYEARQVAGHRDTVTGTDLVFVAASDAPLGIYSAGYDPDAPARLRWNPEPEILAEVERGEPKWFGLTAANGALYASNRDGVFRRIDGPAPRWDRVADLRSPPGTVNPEVRGLTAVPNIPDETGWPEPVMLVFSRRGAMWRMRAGADHEVQLERDLAEAAAPLVVGWDVRLAEAAFNRLIPWTDVTGRRSWPIGFQIAFGDPGARPDDILGTFDGAEAPDLTAQIAVHRTAPLVLRGADGTYSGVTTIRAAESPSATLILARDFETSPFAGEAGVVYAAGGNVSMSGRREALGLAWIYRGAREPSPPPEACAGPAAPLDQTFAEGEIIDAARDRRVAYRAYFSESWRGCAPVVLVSHGGSGSTRGHRNLAHLGAQLAAHGYFALHLNHLPSSSASHHRLDRPADVSFVLTALETGMLTRPSGFPGRLDLDRVAHAGHSWGAYTSQAVGGAIFEQGAFRDERIDAIIPISPQGPGQFGAFDEEDGDNSWRTIAVPTYWWVGGEEVDGSADGGIRQEGWRLVPFERASAPPDRYLTVVPGQDHNQMGNGGSPEVERFVAENVRVFLDAYLRGRPAAACEIGRVGPLGEVDHRTKLDPEGLAASCR